MIVLYGGGFCIPFAAAYYQMYVSLPLSYSLHSRHEKYFQENYSNGEGRGLITDFWIWLGFIYSQKASA
jgi:hypothetical protein